MLSRPELLLRNNLRDVLPRQYYPHHRTQSACSHHQPPPPIHLPRAQAPTFTCTPAHGRWTSPLSSWTPLAAWPATTAACCSLPGGRSRLTCRWGLGRAKRVLGGVPCARPLDAVFAVGPSLCTASMQAPLNMPGPWAADTGPAPAQPQPIRHPSYHIPCTNQPSPSMARPLNNRTRCACRSRCSSAAWAPASAQRRARRCCRSCGSRWRPQSRRGTTSQVRGRG